MFTEGKGSPIEILIKYLLPSREISELISNQPGGDSLLIVLLLSDLHLTSDQVALLPPPTKIGSSLNGFLYFILFFFYLIFGR